MADEFTDCIDVHFHYLSPVYREENDRCRRRPAIKRRTLRFTIFRLPTPYHTSLEINPEKLFSPSERETAIQFLRVCSLAIMPRSYPLNSWRDVVPPLDRIYSVAREINPAECQAENHARARDNYRQHPDVASAERDDR